MTTPSASAVHTNNSPPVVLLAFAATVHFQREILIGLGLQAQQLSWRLEPAEAGRPQRRAMAAGIIAYSRTAAAHRALRRLGLPLVELGVGMTDLGIDEDAVGAQAVAHLAAAGYRRIAMLRGIDQHPGPRAAGVLAAAQRLRLPVDHLGIGIGGPDDQQVGDWLSQRSSAQALGVICHNDLMAWRIAGICRANHLALPGRIGLLGCDDDPLVAALCPVPLSSVAMPHRHLGGEALRLLADLLAGQQRPAPRLLPPGGVQARASTNAEAVADPLVASACAWIAAHATQPIGIDTIAAAVQSGRRSLERRFRAVLGRSPLDQLRLARLAIAQQALRRGATVAQAATDVGWSVDALTQACRTWLGTTPAALARTD